jgi:hypothetical protein
MGVGLSSPALAEDWPYADVFLSHQRLCQECRGERVSETHVRLINRKGEAIVVPITEIVGVDAHPIKRRVMDHFVRNLNPTASYVLFPDAHYGANNGLYGHAYSAPYYWQGTTPPNHPYTPTYSYHTMPK